jgi:hypothetical protein
MQHNHFVGLLAEFAACGGGGQPAPVPSPPAATVELVFFAKIRQRGKGVRSLLPHKLTR